MQRAVRAINRRHPKRPPGHAPLRATSSWPSLAGCPPALAPFSSASNGRAQNQMFDAVRNPNALDTYLSLSAASSVPFLSLWTASWCPTCRTIAPLIRSLILEDRIGEDLGGVNYAPVEFDSPDAHSLASTYMITSIPTLLAFDARRGEPAARVVDGRKLSDRQFLADWIREQARRGGGGRGGGGSHGGRGGSFFGGLFGS